MATRPALPWLEVHAENYMGRGPALTALQRLRTDYPIALHGVGLSLGSAEGLDQAHLVRLADLVQRLDPLLVSEHLSWSRVAGVCFNDLLPLPGTPEALAVAAENIDRVQSLLRRPILVENPATYLSYRHSPIPEPEFLAELARRTGCGLLCDLNNIQVSGHNLGFDPAAYLAALPAAAVGEFHLGGHQANRVGERTILIDDHGSAVADPVWALYAQALARIGRRPTLIEWDSNLPPLPRLIEEAAKADRLALSSPCEPHHAEVA